MTLPTMRAAHRLGKVTGATLLKRGFSAFTGIEVRFDDMGDRHGHDAHMREQLALGIRGNSLNRDFPQ